MDRILCTPVFATISTSGYCRVTASLEQSESAIFQSSVTIIRSVIGRHEAICKFCSDFCFATLILFYTHLLDRTEVILTHVTQGAKGQRDDLSIGILMLIRLQKPNSESDKRSPGTRGQFTEWFICLFATCVR